MKGELSMYDMALFDTLDTPKAFIVRVPGGWIITPRFTLEVKRQTHLGLVPESQVILGTGVFVPFNNEFMGGLS